MKNYFLRTFLFASFAFLCVTQGAAAQELTTTVVAQVSVDNVRITNQTDRAIDLSFEIKNGGSPVSDIAYTIELFSNDLSRVLDRSLSPEILSLNRGATYSASVRYVVPKQFAGTYKIAVNASTKSGMPLSLSFAPTPVKVEGSFSGLSVDPSSCYLRVAGEKGGATYTLVQGVDVMPTETLIGSCKIKNSTSKSVTSRAFFDTFERNTNGYLVSAGVSSDETFTLSPNEEKRVEFALPLPQTPQAYDIVTRFTDANAVSSNNIYAHFVVRGQSATIQTFSLDKTSYEAGENAKATLIWARSADSFPDSRLGDGTPLTSPEATIDISSYDKVCAQTKTISLEGGAYSTTFEMPITADCKLATASVSILNAGSVLAQGTYMVPSEEDARSGIPFVPAFLGVIAILLFAIIILKRMSVRNGAIMSIFALAFASSLFFSHEAHAGSQTVTWSDALNTNLSGTVTIKDVFNEGESVIYSADFSKRYVSCTNGSTRDLLFGYKVLDSTGDVVALKSSIKTEVVSEPIALLSGGSVLAPGFYTLVAEFGENMKVIRTEMEPCTIYEMDEYERYTGVRTETMCPVPIYGALATASLPFEVRAIEDLPNGYLDAATCDAAGGWAYDADSSNTSIDVDVVYKNGAGTVLKTITTTANGSRPDVNSVRDIPGNHGFTVVTPTEAKTGNNVTVEAYGRGVNAAGVANGMTRQLMNTHTINCGGAPTAITLDLNAAPTTVNSGGNTSLSWASTGATSCVASNDKGNPWTGSKALSSAELVPVNDTTTFVMTCSAPSVPSVTKSVIVNAISVGGISTALSADKTCAKTNEPITFTASANGSPITSFILEKDSNADGVFGTQQTLAATAGVQTYAATFGAGVYDFRTSVNGSTYSSVSRITVSDACGGATAPTVDLNAMPTTVSSGGTTNLSWTTTGVSSCVATSNRTGTSWDGAKSLNSSQSVTVTDPTTYTLTCSAPSGTSVSDSVSVGVTAAPAAPTVSITSSSSCVAPNTSISITSAVSGSPVNSNVIQKDSPASGSPYGDGVFGTVADYGASGGTHTYNVTLGGEGYYDFKALVNGSVQSVVRVQSSTACTYVPPQPPGGSIIAPDLSTKIWYSDDSSSWPILSTPSALNGNQSMRGKVLSTGQHIYNRNDGVNSGRITASPAPGTYLVELYVFDYAAGAIVATRVVSVTVTTKPVQPPQPPQPPGGSIIAPDLSTKIWYADDSSSWPILSTPSALNGNQSMRGKVLTTLQHIYNRNDGVNSGRITATPAPGTYLIELYVFDYAAGAIVATRVVSVTVTTKPVQPPQPPQPPVPPQPPTGTCTDSTALNFGGILPCTYANGGGNNGGNNTVSGFTVSGDTKAGIKFISSLGSETDDKNLGVNPTGGFIQNVTLGVVSIRSKATGTPLPTDVKVSYSFDGGKTFVTSFNEVMTYNAATGSYKNSRNGAIGLQFRIRFSKNISGPYNVTFVGTSGAMISNHVMEVSPTMFEPIYREQ